MTTLLAASVQPVEAAQSRSHVALGSLALTLPALLLLCLLFVLPLARLFALSFDGGNLEWYEKALTGGLYTTILLRTFEIAAIVTVCCLVIGYPVAFLLATTTPMWRAIGFSFVLLPLWTSVLVRTYAWMVLLGRNGIINRMLIDSGLTQQPLPLLNSKMAVILGMVHVMLPFMILPTYSAVTRIDPDLPKAARGLGASTLRLALTIYLPLSLRGIVAGVTLVFVVSLGFYITPALLGGGKGADVCHGDRAASERVPSLELRQRTVGNPAGGHAIGILAAEPGRGPPPRRLTWERGLRGCANGKSGGGRELDAYCCAWQVGWYLPS
jgi:putative spermidine/putrescine transport system permease protein